LIKMGVRRVRSTDKSKLGGWVKKQIGQFIGWDDVKALSWGSGGYATAPLIIDTKKGHIYKLNRSNFSRRIGRKWHIIHRYDMNGKPVVKGRVVTGFYKDHRGITRPITKKL
jgi:hypothetical protein